MACYWFGFFGNLYAPYVRGQAYLAAHRYPEAAAEFQKILDHAGIVFIDPIRNAARVQLCRTWVAGQTGKAKAAYQELLALWKDADHDVPLVQQAQAELAKLH